jgi:hypothetical protein
VIQGSGPAAVAAVAADLDGGGGGGGGGGSFAVGSTVYVATPRS